MHETPPATPQPSPDSIGPNVAFDIALGKKLEGKVIEFDEKAYVEHLHGQGLNDEQIAETSIHFKTMGLLDMMLIRDGYYQPQNTTITVIGLSNTILVHETDHRIAHAQNGGLPKSYPVASALTRTIGAGVGVYASGSLAFCEATSRPLPAMGEFLAEMGVASILILGSVALYYVEPSERRARRAEKEVSTQFVKVIDQPQC